MAADGVSLAGRAAVVTGGRSGIGAAVGAALATGPGARYAGAMTHLRVFISASLALGIRFAAAGEDAGSGANAAKVVRLLTVGNSFARNSTHYLPDIVAASGRHRLILGAANLGGCSMERHWRGVEKHEADPNDRAGKPHGGRSLAEILRSEPWDAVTIQQYSMISHDVATYRPYAEKLRDYIRRHAPTAEVMLHQTWAYRADDTTRLKPGYAQADMHREVRGAYRTIARELGLRVIPVGDAFAAARRHPDWQFRRDPDFDYASPVYPNLPKEGPDLCRGWTWTPPAGGRPAKRSCDTHHAGVAGEYLGTAVFYEVLFGERVVGDAFVPGGLSAAAVRTLQEIAHETVADRRAIEPALDGAD